MQRTSGDGFEPDGNGVGKDGFRDTGPNPTTVDAPWLNDVQENLAQYIESRGITIVPDDFTQLTDAIETHFPTSSTDNHVVRFNGTTGKIVQDGSPVTISDTGNVAGVVDLSAAGVLVVGVVEVNDGLVTGITELEMTGELHGLEELSMDSGPITGVTDLTLSGETSYATPKTRTVYVPVASGAAGTNGAGTGIGWVRIANVGGLPGYIAALEAGVTAVFDLSCIPQEMTITQLRVLVQTANTGVLTFRANRYGVSGTTISSAANTATISSSGAALQWLDTGAISFAGAASTYRELIAISANVGDQIRLVEVTYSDVGPRNPS